MKKSPKELFEKHLNELVTSAKLATEHYSILKCFKNKRYKEIVKKYAGYFYFSIHAHKYALVLALSQLYDTKKNTHNIRAVLDHADGNNIISQTCIKKQRRRLDKIQAIAGKVLKLRHHRYAHKMVSLSESEANKRFGISDKEVKRLIETACKIINDISQEYSQTTYASFSHGAKLELCFFLDDLKNCEKDEQFKQ
ncbi:MAG: hypothetical protein DRN81_04795 [Thermoproteota archaeon]|nr:MAG: hypothetical protein DRN81_04795 [Candidatus Korarchaeota archaeon]